MHRFFTLAGLMTLAACGGASSGVSFTSAPDLSPIEVLRSEAGRIANDIDASQMTPLSAIPVSGTASYTGVAAIGFLAESSNGVGLGGDMELAIDFADGDVTGDIANFVSRDGDARDGQLMIEDGVFFPSASGSIVAASLSGDVDLFGGDPVTVEGGMFGGVAGENADNIGGQIDLEWIIPDADPVTFEGAFVLERN